jgi:hypothetical protein
MSEEVPAAQTVPAESTLEEASTTTTTTQHGPQPELTTSALSSFSEEQSSVSVSDTAQTTAASSIAPPQESSLQPPAVEPPATQQSYPLPSVTIHTPRLVAYTVPASGKYTQVIEVKGGDGHQYGSQVQWFFNSSQDIFFSVSADNEKIKPPSRCVTNRGLYTTKPGAKCTVVFEWDNGFSWFTAKDLTYELILRSPDDVQTIMEEEQQQIETRRKEKEAEAASIAEEARQEEAKLQAHIEQQEEEKRREAARQRAEEAMREEAEQARVLAVKQEITTAVQQFRETFILKQKEWSDSRNKVELKMKATLDAVEAQYRQDQQECEAQIVQDQVIANAQLQLLLTNAAGFPELREVLTSLTTNEHAQTE